MLHNLVKMKIKASETVKKYKTMEDYKNNIPYEIIKKEHKEYIDTVDVNIMKGGKVNGNSNSRG